MTSRGPMRGVGFKYAWHLHPPRSCQEHVSTNFDKHVAIEPGQCQAFRNVLVHWNRQQGDFC